MLRSGDSSAVVKQELSKRHFVGAVDPTNEAMLTKAGASAELIAALKNGTYSLSAEQSAAAQQQIVDQAKRRAAEAERSRQFDTLYQAQLARDRAAKPALSAINNVISDAIKTDLVRVQSGAVEHCDEDALAGKKLIAIYFSAQWCGPCRKFTPELVDYYNRVLTQHPDVEVVFCSRDKSANAMQKYMREEKMPWPAIDYAKIESKDMIKKYAGNGIPCLVLLDPTGRVISHSYEGEKYLGPHKVLEDLDAIFAGVAAKQVAGNR